MVDFVKPFPGKNPGDPLTKDEIARAIRLSIAAEQEATQLYNSIAEYVPDKNIQKVMRSVAEEEVVHAGEFQRLLSTVEPGEDRSMAEGMEEAGKMIKGAMYRGFEDELQELTRRKDAHRR